MAKSKHISGDKTSGVIKVQVTVGDKLVYDEIVDKLLSVDKVLDIVNRNGYLKLNVSLHRTPLGDTLFSYDNKAVYYDNNRIEMSPICVEIARQFFINFNENNNREINLVDLKKKVDADSSDAVKKHISIIRKAFMNATGEYVDFFPHTAKIKCYKFDPYY